MLHFNILPPEEKKHIETLRESRIAIVWGSTFFVVLVFTALLLLPSYFTLSLQKDEVLRNLEITENSPVAKRIIGIQQSIIALKKNSEDIKKISKNGNSFSSIVANIVESIPPGITLTALEYDGVLQRLSLHGIADTRAAIARLEEILKKNKNIKDVHIPLSSLVSQKSINFNIAVTVLP